LVFPLVHGSPVFIGQIAQIRSFANVETEFERLALETQLLEGVGASIRAFVMRDSFVADVVVVSDVVAFESVVARDGRRSRWRRGRRFRRRLHLFRHQIRLHSDSFFHGHLAVDFGKLDVVDVDDAATSGEGVTSSPRIHRVTQNDLLRPRDAGRVFVRSRLAPSDQRSVDVDENAEILMPTDFEQRQFAVLDFVRPSAPHVVFGLHDDFETVVQPFGRHVIRVEENEALRRIDEAGLEGDRQSEIAFGQVARAREFVARHVGVLRPFRHEVASFVAAEIDESGTAVEIHVKISGITGTFALSEVDEPFGNGLVDGASVNDVAVEQRVTFGRVELQVVDLHVGEVLVLLRQQGISADEDVGRLPFELILSIEGVGGGLSGDQLVVDVEEETGRRMPGNFVEIPFADGVERCRQSPDLTGGGHDDVHHVLLVEKRESLRALEVTSVGQEGRFVNDVVHLHVEGDGETVRALIQVRDALGGLIRVA